MSAQQVATITVSITAGGTIGDHCAVAVDGTQAGAGVSSAGVVIIGFADHKAEQGDSLKLNRGPTSIAIAGALIDGTENRLKTNASGQLIPWTSGSIVAARLKPGQTATAAGEKIEVFPIYS
ncbi:MAG: hypothetical protein WCA35_06980 [Kovacikia sp.]